MATQGIPHVPGIPLLGWNLSAINRSNPWPSFKKLAEDHGEIFQVNLPFGKKIVFVAGAALVEELCNEKRFRKQVTLPIEEIRKAVHIALFTAGYGDGEQKDWSIAHNIIAPKLTSQAVSERFDDFISTTNELLDMWREKGPDAQIFPLIELDRLNLEATTLALFGQKLNHLHKSHPMLQGMDHSSGEAVQRPSRVPSFLNLGYKGKFNKAISDMRTYAQQVIQHRRENPSDRKDLLAAMMHSSDPETGKQLNDTQIIDEIVSMPIGSSTAPCVIAAGIYYLLKNPQLVTKAREELDSVVGDDELAYGHLSQLQYIEAIVRESSRLSFAAPGFNIEPIHEKGKDTGPVQLAGGKYQIPYNQGMIVVLAGANRDASVFEDPEAFRPERMVGEKFEQLPLGARRYYGNGKRVCVGQHYAWLWKMVVMAKLIKEFDIDEVDSSYELHQEGWFNMRPVDFRAKIKPRKGH